jgi:hypothetical protein
MYKVYEYRCQNPACGIKSELLHDDRDGEVPAKQPCECQYEADPAKLPGVLQYGVRTRIMSAPQLAVINRKNSDFAEREKARLEKRRDDYFNTKGRDEAIERERAVLKKFQTGDST